MDIYVQLLINSLQISAVYVLFSLGLTLIFGVMRIVNFAHGEFFALAALLIAVAVPWLVGLGDGRWLTVSVIGHLLWEKFCKVLGAEDWLADPRFANDELRGKHANLVSERLGAWCAQRSRTDALLTFEKARIPAGPVLSPQEALDDAHIRASGILREIAYPGTSSPAPIVDTPIHLSATPGAIRSRAPILGEHTAEILGEIGYSGEEIERLRSVGVV